MKKLNMFSLRFTVLSVCLFVAMLTAGLSLGLQYHFSRGLAKTAAESSFRATAEKISERMHTLDTQSANLVGVLSFFPELTSYPVADAERRVLSLVAGAMEQNPSLYSFYVGYESGDFFEIINLESSENVRAAYGAAPHDRWLIIRIKERGGERRENIVYLQQNFDVRTRRMGTTRYDPSKRPWFTEAVRTPGIIKTAPYFFSLLKAPGVTYAKSMDQGQRVLAVDISLAGMSNFLQKQRFLPQSEAFLFDAEGSIIARALEKEAHTHHDKATGIDLTEEERGFIKKNPVIRASNEIDWPPFDFALSGKPRGYSIDMLDLLAEKAGFHVEYVNGYSWEGLVELFKKGDLDLLHSLLKTPEREKMGVFTKSYMPMPQRFVVRRGVPLPESFSQLEGKIVAIPKGWATDQYLEENYPGIKRLHVPSTLDAMRAVSAGKADATVDSEPVLLYLTKSYYLDDLQIGGNPLELKKVANQKLHFLVRPDKAVLARILDKALISVTAEERKHLFDSWFGDIIGDTLDNGLGGTVPHRELLELAKTVGGEGGLRVMHIHGEEHLGFVAPMKSIYGTDEYLGLIVPMSVTIRPYMEKIRFALLVTCGLLLLLIPVVMYCATIIVSPINALVHENEKVKQRRYDDVGVVNTKITEILILSRSMVSMAGSIKAHEESLRSLMDSFIRLIATAIDHKSPYTGGHCARVPEIAMMLAKAASDSTRGSLAEFFLETEEEWREFRTAAWLHDCGKVTTPEHIVDKATKLETIYNRIHEVRMRFEVLLRDAEIDYWRGLAQGGQIESLELRLEARRRELKDDFAFIAECNIGGEFMSEDKAARMHEIAKRTWVRYLDDRLGLGHLELQRYPEGVPNLPCEEPLLSDRPEHIIQRPKREALGHSGGGFTMKMPDNLYNLGEIYNLCISRGTLTDEDRCKINEHIVTTIRMLETLPYPENMTRIPEYAGAHHETLIGTGYPRGLKAEDLTIPARIMAVADVFEALTASDRPYKKAKTLNEAVRILSFMVKDQHLDKDLFRVFLESGVYLEYAKKYLHVSQMDEVNVAAYLEKLG